VPQEVDTSPAQRFRIEQWTPYLREAGIDVSFSPFSSRELAATLQQPGRWGRKAWAVCGGLLGRLREAWTASRYDVLYICREGALIGPALAERIASWTGSRIVFDFDDAVWIRYVSPANSYLSYLRFPGKTRTLCRIAREVMAGNRSLQEYASAHNRNVTLVPTTIDTDVYRPLPARDERPLVIGWTGSYSTVQYLQVVRPALERLRARHHFRFVVVGALGFSAAGVEVEHRPWRSATEAQDLADIDVGLMPLPDADWERHKCGLKALQYMALGRPAVVSPVGANREIVEDGENGFLATTEDDWVSRLGRLLEDADLRARLGRAARETVERRFSARVHAPRVAEIFRRAA
jgi:glycosyltransferase involved in cell wall biosynthesis